MIVEDDSQQAEPPVPATTDICSQINLISSIQYQQSELSKLATLLQSEQDREKYMKVIEMSKIIQSKLDVLHDEKKRANIIIGSNNTRCSDSYNQKLDKKSSLWSLNNSHDSYYFNFNNICRSSTTSSQSSENTVATASTTGCVNRNALIHHKNSFPLNDEQSTLLFTDTSSRYNGHSCRAIDRVTSLHFQQYDSVYNSRRPSADTIPIDQCLKKEEEKKLVVKPVVHSLRHRKSFVNTDNSDKRVSVAASTTTESDEDEELVSQKAIQVAVVRRDASLIKFEKVVDHKKEGQSLTSTSTTGNTPNAKSNITTNATRRISQHNPLEKSAVTIEKKRVSFSDEKYRKETKKGSSGNTGVGAGLLTPPDSPQRQNQFDKEINSESYFDLNSLPPIIHVQKKTHQSLNGLLKRTYQLNQYSVTKTNSTTLPFSSGILYKTFDSRNGKPKLLLKLVIISLDIRSSEKQRRFGFTFWWQDHQFYNEDNKSHNDDAKFALAPDSLVKEALTTWVESQNEGVVLLPSISQSDEILRDGRKLYVVYDTGLF